MDFKNTIQDYAEQPISRQLLLNLLSDYKRPNDKISELLKQQLLISLKKGLYITGPSIRIAQPEPFLIANHLRGPSYISMESALSYWGLIPEKVYDISSVTTENTKVYQTLAGRFSYTHVPLPYYAFGIVQAKITQKQQVLIASPEKAICDKIITTAGLVLRSIKQVKELLIDDFRIDEELLTNLHVTEIEKWLESTPKKNSIGLLIKTLKSL